MWCSKMAARWRGKDVDLNADNGDFLTVNTSNELLLNRGDEGVDMDSQSCTDHSILSIFDDPTVASEGKSGVEEENESLLSALTEMLDSVEDDDGTLSPFDVLPDTKLLTSTGSRDISVVNLLSGRATPGPKLPNTIFTNKRRGKKEDVNKIHCNSLPHMLTQQTPTVCHSKTDKVEKEVEVFTSTSLVNLVKLMHPYCLKLHVEEESTQRKNCTLFTQGEVWRYERPTEESDEEINVVSDDEEPVKETKRNGERDEERDDGRFLKSVLVNGNSPRAPPSRKKKRVSFGPIQVASFNTSEEESLNETNDTGEAVSLPPNSPQALVNSAGPALEHQATCSEEKCDKEDAVPPKGETKAKSLSLQQYRQLRQKRQPLVEKKGNNATKWPSVPEPPTELTPILCFVAQKTAHQYPDLSSTHHQQHKPGNKTLSHHAPLSLRPSSSQVKASTPLNCSRLKRPRPQSKSLSPDSPLPDATAHPHVKIPKGIKSPVKKPSLVSSDPPNPVLVPLPVCQTASPATALLSPESKVEFTTVDSESSTPSQKPQRESSASSLQKLPSSSEQKPQLLLVKQHSPNLLQDSRTKIVSGVSFRCPLPPPPLCPPATIQTQSDSEKIELEPKIPHLPSAVTVKQIRCSSSSSSSTPTSLTDAPIQMKRAVSSTEETQATLQVDCPAQSAISASGIVATDLTSLLEQFEETQAKEERVCENAISTTPASRLQTDGHLELQGNLSVASKKTSRISTTSSVESLELQSLRNPPQLKPLERVDVPEPLGTEIILSTQQEQPAKRKTSTSKAIQIIDPRPLPSRKTHVSTSEPPPPHVYLSVCADHDYCRSVDHSLTGATQHSRTKPSPLKDVSKITHEFQVNSLDSGATAAAAAEWNTQTSTGHTKCVTQHHSDQPTARSKTSSFTEGALHFSDCAAAAATAATTTTTTGDKSDDKAAPYTLPTPPPSPPNRGRERRRYQRRSPRSDSSSSSHCSSCSCSSSSSSSSTSRSPKRRRLHHRRSESSSCSSSPCRSISRSPPRRYRLARSRSTCSRSRSRSWSQSRSQSRSRSPSPRVCLRQWKDVYSKESRRLRRENEMRIQKLKAIDERRVVYVGRIGRSMTHGELRERFTQFGEVECVSLHFRDRGDHYGFVTFYNMDDAFAAIDNGYKLRKPDELPFDLCFGGRRQFCNSNYADLDASRDADSSAAMNRFKDVDFDSLLKQAQRGLNT
uniref:peroxisome proliferator-activated receptor gamma coactivator-related protein 1-like isoform X2 n=1 Tax=Solea senegalensis TaxID=28829 RepID=UPI001CD87A53|nr:peroxisome proliferator-activated receptor gamma coactivator-related protein 1-like isoform X2 [Solea senegalensis]